MAGLIRIFPHRTASAEDAAWSWWLDRGAGKVECPALVTGWDYSLPLKFGVEVTIALGSVLEATGLGSVDDLGVVAVVDCRSTASRFIGTGRFGIVGDEAVGSVEIEVPAGAVAQSLKLSSSVVLAEDGQPGGRRAAVAKGSRLISSDSLTVLLEGDSGRFPTESAAFSKRGLGDVPWTLMLSYEDVSDSFMGSVRLLVNNEHPVGKAVLDPEQASRFAGLMRADLLRGLVARMSQDVTAEDYDDESVAGVVDALCQSALGHPLREAVALFGNDPVEFELLLQKGLDPYRELVD